MVNKRFARVSEKDEVRRPCRAGLTGSCCRVSPVVRLPSNSCGNVRQCGHVRPQSYCRCSTNYFLFSAALEENCKPS